MAVKIRDVARVDLLLHVLADRDSQAFHVALTSRIAIRGTPAPAPASPPPQCAVLAGRRPERKQDNENPPLGGFERVSAPSCSAADAPQRGMSSHPPPRQGPDLS